MCCGQLTNQWILKTSQGLVQHTQAGLSGSIERSYLFPGKTSLL